VKKPIPAHKALAVSALLLGTFWLAPTAAFAAAPLPLPTSLQLAWQRHEFIVFAHFGMNTFTDREWGEGKEHTKLFNPTDFDARQWATVLKEAGVKLLILTAKHHDGFCLWPSRFTEHCVKNSPWRGGKGDVVREVVDAMREKQIRVGLYLSPWDRNQPTYGDSPKYNEYFRNQLRELPTMARLPRAGSTAPAAKAPTARSRNTIGPPVTP
jgi:alpha-L-fucosidase